jgi:hypothetical protein
MKTRLRKRGRAGSYTFEDFCEIIREDQKADLIDGVIYMASPENTDANDLFGWLFLVMQRTRLCSKNEARTGVWFPSCAPLKCGRRART